MNVKGLDEGGYIAPAYSVSHIATEFVGVVQSTLQRLEQCFPEQIHSVYLYGSVARGDAIPELSDLDLSLVFHQPLEQETRIQLAELAREISDEFSVITKLDFDPGHLAEVLADCEEYRWQFWLKHCCCCLWGEDLSTRFRRHKPSVKLANALNGDLAAVLTETLSQLPLNQTQPLPAKVIAKKLLRSAYLLVADKDQSWLTDLRQIAQALKRFYPDDVTSIDIALDLALGGTRNVSCINELIVGFGYKISEQIEKQ
ncbi:nucleotidyltransferase domain-containing protein [Vibrio sinaloensis]|uniref:nucleotidyltransferase domain-containing protein n=1 Tax=Photobacterium sp. (strain ATCC 43367) TaxID=379097 RepID=UPI0035E6482E